MNTQKIKIDSLDDMPVPAVNVTQTKKSFCSGLKACVYRIFEQNPLLQRYLFEIGINWLLKCFWIFVICYIFQEPIKTVLGACFVDPILKHAQRNIFVDIAIIGGLIYVICFCIKEFKSGLFITGRSILITLTCFAIYFLFRFSHDLEFYHFTIPALRGIAYLDILIFAFLLRVSSFKLYSHRLALINNRYSLAEDNPLGTYPDLYGYEGYAKRISKHINETTTASSFGIAVVGQWGSGKSDFLKRLKLSLDINTNNLVFEFNPWKLKSDAIIDEFFKTLSIKIKPYNKSVSNDLKEYSRRILQTAKELHYRILDTLINVWKTDNTLQNQHDDIDNAIKESGKKIIVLLDDLDRLSGKEIMEVLRIIRNTANFSNIFFIAGVDHSYILNALKSSKDFPNEGEYLKKIFQLTITLPATKKKSMMPELENLLITPDLNETEVSQIKKIIKVLSVSAVKTDNGGNTSFFQEGLLEKFIDNVRDLKRFSNSFKIAFNYVKDEVELLDLFVLELIKNKHLEYYNMIRNLEVITFSSSAANNFDIVDAKLKYVKGDTIPEKSLEHLGKALKYLNNPEGKNHRRFCSARNFYLYFSYQLFDQISFSEFNSALDEDADRIIKKFNHWIDKGKQVELTQILREITMFDNENDFLKMMIVYLNIKVEHHRWLDFVIELVYDDRETNLERYFENDRVKYFEFIRGITENTKISSNDKSSILKRFLKPLASDDHHADPYIITDKKVIQEIMLHILRDELDHMILERQTMGLLYDNIDTIAPRTNVVSLYNPALKLMHSHLITNDRSFRRYIGLMILPLSQPYDGDMMLEPYYDKIFDDVETLINKIEEITLEESDLEIVKNELLKHLKNSPNEKVLKFDDSLKRNAVENNMVKQGFIKKSELRSYRDSIY